MIQHGKQNYLTVPAAIKELEKIEIIRPPDRSYRFDHAVTATQKNILAAFDIIERNVREQAADLEALNTEAV